MKILQRRVVRFDYHTGQKLAECIMGALDYLLNECLPCISVEGAVDAEVEHGLVL